MAQFVGQRISLISRSDVRYLGTLDEVNEESSTVTLKDVKSFGTEGRRGIPTEEIPANDTVYPYISFKGSDVKDLRIHKDDEHAGDQPSVGGGSIQSDMPAPPGRHFPGPEHGPFPPYLQQQPHFMPPRHPSHPQHSQFPYMGPNQFGMPGGPPSGPGPGPGYPQYPYGGPPGWYGGPRMQLGFPPYMQGPYGGPPPMNGAPPMPPRFPMRDGSPPMREQQQPPMQPPRQAPIGMPPVQNGAKQGAVKAVVQIPSIPTGPRAATQGPAAGMSSESNGLPATSVKLPIKILSKPSTPAAVEGPPKTPAVPIANKPDVAQTQATPAARASGSAGARSQPQSKPMTTTQIAAKASVPPVGPAHPASRGPVAPAIPSYPAAAANAAQYSGRSAATAHTKTAQEQAVAAVKAAMAKLPGGPPNDSDTQSYSAANLNQQMNGLSMSGGHDLDAYQSNGMHGQRGGPRRGTARGRGGLRQPARKMEIPKDDYDFEKANAKFNKQDGVKDVMTAGSPVDGTPETSNAHGTVQSPKLAPGSQEDVEIPPAPYVKSSFFDDISSDLKDRQEDGSRQSGGRERRGEEIKRNLETFGQGSVDGFRGSGGGYRGRGRGRGGYRGRGYGGSGGGRGGGGMRKDSGAAQPTITPAA